MDLIKFQNYKQRIHGFSGAAALLINGNEPCEHELMF
jgi:hypothetical protein